MGRIELNSLTLEELEKLMVSIGEKTYRGEQLFTFLHKNCGKRIEDISVFSIGLQDKLKKVGWINRIKILKRLDSNIDHTKKYLFSLEDNNIIEGVIMEYRHGLTACISTQVGCKMGCSFCASTKEGFIRNLSSAEMLEQIYNMERDLNKKISNIVLMGSGEPLDNYDNTLKFLNIIHSERGHNISYRNITLSTCGVVPKIYQLADEGVPVTLSISLHSPFDDVRKSIMPISNKYSISEIIQACKYYFNITNRRITIEYTLIEGVNDRYKDLKRLVSILKDLNCHINLIPLNPVEEYNRQRPSEKYVERFKKALEVEKLPVTIRREMGSDISASCGQLRRSYIRDKDTKTFQ